MYLPANTNINCGVYRIKNTRNGHFYIGSSKNLNRRFRQHRNALTKGKHHCNHLQNAWNSESDTSVFVFEKFIYCTPEKRIELEQGCIDFMKPYYNENKIAGIPPVNYGEDNWLYKNGEKSSFYGKPAWNKGLPKELQPAYGKPGSLLGRTGPEHPSWGKPSWNKGKPLTSEHKQSISVAKYNSKKPHSVRKLNETDVLSILASVTESLAELSSKYAVTNETISRILRNKTWRYIPRDKVWTASELRLRGWNDERRKKVGEKSEGSNSPFSKLTEEQVLEIRASPLKHTELAKIYGVHPTTIFGARKGSTWKHLPFKQNKPRAEDVQPLDWPSRALSYSDSDKS